MSGSVGRLRFFGYLRLYVESLYSQTEEFRVEQEFLFKMVEKILTISVTVSVGKLSPPE